jgi:hypothetical protein
MNDRWLPVFAAILGVLGGVGGAAVGGYIANQGQEQQLEAERATRMRELRIDTYVKFLVAAENEATDANEHRDVVVKAAADEVALVAGNDAVPVAASRLLNTTLTFGDSSQYRRARDKYVTLANADIESER